MKVAVGGKGTLRKEGGGVRVRGNLREQTSMKRNFFSGWWNGYRWLVVASLLGSSGVAETLKMQGSPVVAHVMIAAAPVLRARGIEIKVGVEGSSAVAVAMLGDEEVTFALTMRALTGTDRARFPEKEFKEFQIGTQAVALIVSDDVWQSGVRSLTKAQLQAVYEGKILNWKELGGGDLPIKFYNTERGRGIWELVFIWIYKEVRQVPLGKFPITVDGEDARNTVQFNSGSMAMAQINWIDGKKVHGLAIKDEKGVEVFPTEENVLGGKYPLARPAMVVVGEKPVGVKRKVIDFLLGEEGQAIVGKSDLIPNRVTPLK